MSRWAARRLAAIGAVELDRRVVGVEGVVELALARFVVIARQARATRWCQEPEA